MREVLDYYHTTLDALLRGEEPPAPDEVLERFEGIPSVRAPRPATTPAAGKLNIALVCREYPPETAFGGMATFTYHLAHGLADAGHRVAVITAGRPLIRRDLDDRVDVFQIEPRLRGARDSFEKLNRRGWLSWAPMVYFHSLGALRAIREIEAAHGPFDVLDLADHTGEGLAPALFWPGPTTLRLYSPWAVLAAMRTFDDPASPAEAAEIPILESALLHRAPIITTPSEDLGARVKTFFNLPTRFPFVPNPLDIELFRPGGRCEQLIRICFVGRLEERKGIKTLLEAIPRVLQRAPDVQFEIVGPDPQGFASTLSASAQDRVQFRGRIPLADLPRVYQESAIAVVPSVYDNSPYTCMEPMACGIPVVGTSVGGIGEYVIDGQTGILVPPSDPEALADAIVDLANDANLREELGRSARAHVERCFDFGEVAKRMEVEYRNAINNVRYDDPPPQSVRLEFNRERPELNRIDAIVFAGIEDGDEAARTIRSAQDQGAEVTVVWDGPVPVSFVGARTTGTSGHAGSDAARILSTLLGQSFTVLHAGETLSAGLLDRATRLLAEGRQLAVTIDRVRVVCTSAARGLLLADAATWTEVLDRIEARSIRD